MKQHNRSIPAERKQKRELESEQSMKKGMPVAILISYGLIVLINTIVGYAGGVIDCVGDEKNQEDKHKY